MPSPIKERYQIEGVDRLPCDDRKVADTLSCTDYEVYCMDPNQQFTLSIQGAGDIYKIDTSCANFMKMGGMNWGEAQTMLNKNFATFQEKYTDSATGNMNSYSMNKVTF